MSIREELLKPKPQKFEPFEAFGQKLSIRCITGRERDMYEGQRLLVHGTTEISLNYDNMRARLVVLVLGDAEGKRIFQDSDAIKVGELPADELHRIYEAGLRVNGMDKQAEETIRKNSETVRNGDGITDSPESYAAASLNCSN